MIQRSREVAATGVLKSRIGRRFVALFLGCALLPLVAFAWLTLTKVTQQMNAETRESLHNGAKTAGMGIAARLSQVAADLSLVAELVHQDIDLLRQGGTLPLPQRVTDRCETLWMVEGERTVVLRGESVLPMPSWRASELAHLAAGKPVVRAMGSPPQLTMVLSLDRQAAEPRLLAASLRADRFWDAQELRSPGAEFAVFDTGGQPLFDSFRAMPDLAPLLLAMQQSPASGTIEWVVDGEPHLARYWRAFLSPQYDIDLLVVQSKSRRDAFAVADAFVHWFLLTAACTLLFVLFASLVQLRRTLGPIVSLNEATRRVAAGELGVRVSIESRDEFGQLGGAFNHMTAQIQESARRRAQTERELVESRDQALAAARAKADFVTNVSHEFRTPMAEILGAAEILAGLDDADVAVRREFTAIVLSGARRLAQLVDDVLEVGSSAPWDMGPVDPGGSLADAVACMPQSVRARIRADIAPDLPEVSGVGARLTEVWCRLLDNAAKFSGPDAPIHLRARHRGAEIVVEVADQGVGISRMDLSRIFEPFSQVGRDQMTEKAHGTGLGLTLARRAIERHGGRIEVESELGNGALFRVFLPVLAPAPVGAD